MRWVLLTAYVGYALLSAGIHLARRDRAARRAHRRTDGVVAALVVRRGRRGIAAEGVVWVLAGGLARHALGDRS